MKILFGHTKSSIGDEVILAKAGDEIIGRLQLQTPRPYAAGTSLVLGIYVRPEWRRRGIATSMWEFAKSQGLKPMHELEKTADGEAWAKTVKEEEGL